MLQWKRLESSVQAASFQISPTAYVLDLLLASERSKADTCWGVQMEIVDCRASEASETLSGMFNQDL